MRNQTSFIAVVAATLVVFSVAGASLAETGDTKQAKITRAMQAAPESISKNANRRCRQHRPAIGFKWLALLSNIRSGLNSPDVQRRCLDAAHDSSQQQS
jgi:uncharacterized BrkB/YihY/UPF0761 family membrane protein